jgi:hypothetical protein
MARNEGNRCRIFAIGSPPNIRSLSEVSENLSTIAHEPFASRLCYAADSPNIFSRSEIAWGVGPVLAMGSKLLVIR